MIRGSLLICFLIAFGSTSATGDRQQLRSDMLYSEGNRRAGQYRYGYAVKQGEKQFHHQRSLNGAMYGCYGFVDPQGKLFITHYLADMAGYRLVNMANPDKKLLQRIQSLGSADHPIELQSFFPLECQADGDIKLLQETAAQTRSSLPTVQSSSLSRYAPTISNQQISGFSTVHSEKTNLKSTDHVLVKLFDPTTTQVPQKMMIPQQPESSPEKSTKQSPWETLNKIVPSSSYVKSEDSTANQRKYSIGSRFHSTKEFGSSLDTVYDPSFIRVKVVYDDEDSLAARKGAVVKAKTEESPSVGTGETVGTWFHSNPSSTKLAVNINKKELSKVPTNVIENGDSLSKLTESVEMKHFQKVDLELHEAASDSNKEPAANGVSNISIIGSDMKISAQDAIDSSKMSSENVGVDDGPLVISSLKPQFSSHGIVGSDTENNDNVKLNLSNDKNEEKSILGPENVAVVKETLSTGLSFQTDRQLESESIVGCNKTESGELSVTKTSSPVLSSKTEKVHGSLLSGSVIRAESQQHSEGMDNSKNTEHNRISEVKLVVKNESTISSSGNNADVQGSLTTKSTLRTDSQPSFQNKEVVNPANIKNVELRGIKATVKGTQSSSLNSETVADGNGSLATKSVSQAESQQQHKLPELATGVRQQSNSMFRGRVKYKDYASSSPQSTDLQRKTSYSPNSGQYKADSRGSFKSSVISGTVGKSDVSFKSGQFNGIDSAQSSFKLNSDTKTSGQKIQGSVSTNQDASANKGVQRGDSSMAAILSNLGNDQKSDKQYAESLKSNVGYSEGIKAPAENFAGNLNSDSSSRSTIKSSLGEIGTSEQQSTSMHVSDSNKTSKIDDSSREQGHIKKVGNTSPESIQTNQPMQNSSSEQAQSILPSIQVQNDDVVGNVDQNVDHVTESNEKHSLTLKSSTNPSSSGNIESPSGHTSKSSNSASLSQPTLRLTTGETVTGGLRLTDIRVSGSSWKSNSGNPLYQAFGDIKESVSASSGSFKSTLNSSANSNQLGLESSTTEVKSDMEALLVQNGSLIRKTDDDLGATDSLKYDANVIQSGGDGGSSQIVPKMATNGSAYNNPDLINSLVGNSSVSTKQDESTSQLTSKTTTEDIARSGTLISSSGSQQTSSEAIQQSSNVMKSSTIGESASQFTYRSSTLEVEPTLPAIDNSKKANSDQNLGYTKVSYDEGSTLLLSKPSSVETMPELRRVPAIRVAEYVEQTIRNQASSKSSVQPFQEHASGTRSTLDSKITSTSNSEGSIEQPYMDDTVVVEAALDDAQKSMIPKLPATPRTTTEASADSVTIAYSIPSYSHKPPVHPRPTTSYRPSISDTYHQAATVTTTIKPEPPVRTTIGPSGDIYDEIDEDVAPVSASHPTQMSPQIPSIPNSGSGISIQPSISSHCYEVILQIPANAKQVVLKTESSSFRVYGDGDPLNRVREVQPGVYEVNVGATGGIKFQQYQDFPHKDTDKLHLNLGKGFNYGDLVPIPANRGSVDSSDPSLNNPYLPQVTIEQARSVGSAEVVTVGEDSHELSTEQRALLNLVPSWKKVFLYY